MSATSAAVAVPPQSVLTTFCGSSNSCDHDSSTHSARQSSVNSTSYESQTLADENSNDSKSPGYTPDELGLNDVCKRKCSIERDDDEQEDKQHESPLSSPPLSQGTTINASDNEDSVFARDSGRKLRVLLSFTETDMEMLADLVTPTAQNGSTRQLCLHLPVSLRWLSAGSQWNTPTDDTPQPFPPHWNVSGSQSMSDASAEITFDHFRRPSTTVSSHPAPVHSKGHSPFLRAELRTLEDMESARQVAVVLNRGPNFKETQDSSPITSSSRGERGTSTCRPDGLVLETDNENLHQIESSRWSQDQAESVSSLVVDCSRSCEIERCEVHSTQDEEPPVQPSHEMDVGVASGCLCMHRQSAGPTATCPTVQISQGDCRGCDPFRDQIIINTPRSPMVDRTAQYVDPPSQSFEYCLDETVSDSVSQREAPVQEHNTLEKRAQEINDQINRAVAAIKRQDTSIGVSQSIITLHTDLVEKTTRDRQEQSAKLVELEQQKRWSNLRMQIVYAESRHEAHRMLLRSYLECGDISVPTLVAVVGLTSVLMIALFLSILNS